MSKSRLQYRVHKNNIGPLIIFTHSFGNRVTTPIRLPRKLKKRLQKIRPDVMQSIKNAVIV